MPKNAKDSMLDHDWNLLRHVIQYATLSMNHDGVQENQDSFSEPGATLSLTEDFKMTSPSMRDGLTQV